MPTAAATTTAPITKPLECYFAINTPGRLQHKIHTLHVTAERAKRSKTYLETHAKYELAKFYQVAPELIVNLNVVR